MASKTKLGFQEPIYNLPFIVIEGTLLIKYCFLNSYSLSKIVFLATFWYCACCFSYEVAEKDSYKQSFISSRLIPTSFIISLEQTWLNFSFKMHF